MKRIPIRNRPARAENRFSGITEDRTRYLIRSESGSGTAVEEKYYSRFILTAKNSPTAQRCVELLHSFLVADGFADREFAASPANPSQSWDGLLSQAAYSWLYTGAVAFTVMPDLAAGGISQVGCLPSHRVFRTLDGRYAYNRRFKGEKGYREDETILYPHWDGSPGLEQVRAEAVRQIKEYGAFHGYVSYCYISKPMEETYPVPAWYSAEYDILLDHEYSRHEYNQLRTGFKAHKVIVTPEMSSLREVDEAGNESRSEYDLFREQAEAAMDPDTAGGFIHIQARTSAEGKELPVKVLDLAPYQVAADIGLRAENCAARIARAFGAPPVMIGLAPAGGIGDTKQIADEISLLNNRINKEQRFLADHIARLAARPEAAITTHNPINYLPQEVMARMTADEIRAIAGLDPLPQVVADAQQKTLDALAALSPLVATKVIEYMSPEQILSLIGLKPATPPANATPGQI